MSKLIYDSIHGYMEMSELCLSIIDNPTFKRLKKIKQTGTCYEVWPGASHNRFEHSLGVGHLAEKMLKNIKFKQPELNIDDKSIELVKIAGLCHDLGHGPYSHTFDNEVIPELCKTKEIKNKTHEERSCMMLEYMCKTYNIDISDKEIKIIQDMIEPETSKMGFIYQIVNNKKCGIDVDKFDYLMRDPKMIGLNYSFDSSRLIEQSRVIDGNICYPDKLRQVIMDMFHTRYTLHRNIYNHPVVKSVEYMIRDILILADNYMFIAESCDDPERFSNMNDDIISVIEYCNEHTLGEKNQNHLRAQKLIKAIQMRDLYKYDGEYNSNECDEVVSKLQSGYIVQKLRIGYNSKNETPLLTVPLYNLKKPDQMYYSEEINQIKPSKYLEEDTYRVFKTDN